MTDQPDAAEQMAALLAEGKWWHLRGRVPTPEVTTSEVRAFTMEEHIADAIRAYGDRRAAEALQWRPIETAPKDGTPILFWCVHDLAKYSTDAVAEGYAAPAVGYWTDHNGGGWTRNGLAGPPTHWMPLPPPPVSAEGK